MEYEPEYRPEEEIAVRDLPVPCKEFEAFADDLAARLDAQGLDAFDMSEEALRQWEKDNEPF